MFIPTPELRAEYAYEIKFIREYVREKAQEFNEKDFKPFLIDIFRHLVKKGVLVPVEDPSKQGKELYGWKPKAPDPTENFINKTMKEIEEAKQPAQEEQAAPPAGPTLKVMPKKVIETKPIRLSKPDAEPEPPKLPEKPLPPKPAEKTVKTKASKTEPAPEPIVLETKPTVQKDLSQLTKKNYEFIDLGLPSGTLWATENAIKNGLTHFIFSQAITAFGNHVPDAAQMNELFRECSWAWDNDRRGYNVVGKNGNSIFLPADGLRCGSKIFSVGIYGDYWTRTGFDIDNARNLAFNAGNIDANGRYYMSYGFSVRLVKTKEDAPEVEEPEKPRRGRPKKEENTKTAVEKTDAKPATETITVKTFSPMKEESAEDNPLLAFTDKQLWDELQRRGWKIIDNHLKLQEIRVFEKDINDM